MDYLSLCLICKDENDYLPEWLDYHILMGVDRFYIYDNECQTSLRETLEEYIDSGWVVVVNIPGRAMQLYAYDHCLHTFGRNTFWMGFIDADEFLVPKTASGLKEFLKDYETYGGLAVNSIFFGSNGYQTRPAIGQVAAYTKSTHATFSENDLVKSIVRPGLALMPNSPHDFTYTEGTWCVNENFLRVDGQRSPNCTNKIQLNHYYCRSESEIELKLRRGNSGDVMWPRKRFDLVNQLATCEDGSILQNLNVLLQKAGMTSHDEVSVPQEAGLLEQMSILARLRPHPALFDINLVPSDARHFRTEILDWMELKAKGLQAKDRGDFKQVCQIILSLIQIQPQYPCMYIDLSNNYLNLGNPEAAWQALTRAWQLAPNTYFVQMGMALYFLWIKKFSLAENTCQLLLEIAPHNLTVLGFLTQALIGQGRFEEALKMGVPVVELSAQVAELPDGMDIFLIKKMADYLLKKKDYTGAAHLWEIGARCQPGEVNALIELGHVLILAGEKSKAYGQLIHARLLAPQNEAVLALLKQVE